MSSVSWDGPANIPSARGTTGAGRLLALQMTSEGWKEVVLFPLSGENQGCKCYEVNPIKHSLNIPQPFKGNFVISGFLLG